MSGPEHFTIGRTERLGENTFRHDAAIDYTDGFRITVGWVGEDDTWYARLTGTTTEDGPLGHGATKEAALLDLCCALAALANALDNWRKPNA